MPMEKTSKYNLHVDGAQHKAGKIGKFTELKFVTFQHGNFEIDFDRMNCINRDLQEENTWRKFL